MHRSDRLASRLVCLLLVTLFFAPSTVHAQSSQKQLKLAAYNLWNMFDIYDDPYTQDESTRVKPRKQIEAVAQIIKEMDADVVGCVELENDHILRAMAMDMLPESGYKYFGATESNSGRGIQIGVMSRLPILSITSHKFRKLTLPGEKRTWSFARDLVQVTVQVTDSQILDVFLVHFKSKRSTSGDPESGKWRLAEATMARQIMEQTHKAHPDHWIAIMGDFNDTPESKTIQHLLAAPKFLTDTHSHLPADKRITYLHKPYRSTIDYILAGPQLIKHLDKSKTGLPADESKLAGSDHAPIYATFNLN
ncbi:MAG: endonuclease/exonuclease/phosphatase family protein [Phycisphaeraceae bacterium JB051]